MIVSINTHLFADHQKTDKIVTDLKDTDQQPSLEKSDILSRVPFFIDVVHCMGWHLQIHSDKIMAKYQLRFHDQYTSCYICLTVG